MLLAQWEAADRDRTPFVWLSLDSNDSDPVRLWMHVIAGLHGIHARVGERSTEHWPPAQAHSPERCSLF